MEFSIIKLNIYTSNGVVSFPFDSRVTFIYGNIGVGKTTLISLILYCLGGDLVETPAVKDQLMSAELHAEINYKSFVFRREYPSSQVFIDQDGFIHNIHKKQITNFLYKISGTFSIYYEQTGASPLNQLTFKNYLWYSYLRQSDLDSNFFYLNRGANDFYQIASINVLASLLGKNSFVNGEQKKLISTAKKRLNKYENGIEALNYVLNENLIKYITGERIRLEAELQNLDLTDQATSERHLASQIEITKYQLEFLKQYEPILSKRNKFFQEYESLKKQVQEFPNTNANFNNLFYTNLFELGEIFKHCLISIGFPSIASSDKVRFDPETLSPTITNEYTNISYSFDSLGSGGKKTLFKICFLIAVHIKTKILPKEESRLPTLIIIDTPMKNISEREDKELFDHFYLYLLKLFHSTLSDTQLIIVDKEKNDIIAKSEANIITMNKEQPLFPGFVDDEARRSHEFKFN